MERIKTSAELGAEAVGIKLGQKSTSPLCPKKSIKDEVLLVFYVAIGNMPDAEVKRYMGDITNSMNLSERFSDVTCFYVPIRDGNSRIERVHTGDKKFNKLGLLEKEFSKMNMPTIK